MLTEEKLKSLKPGEIIAQGIGKIEHYWFNDAKDVVDENGLTLVNWIAVRGHGFYDWAIYHSLGFEKAPFMNGTSHLSVSFKEILHSGSKLTNKEDVKRLVDCDEGTLNLYRS